jgi:hypothetical protein
VRLPKKDLVATALVALAGLVYLLWAIESAPPGMDAVRVSGSVVLALGFAASASAVVPTFFALLHGNKAYLAVTSLIGLGALIAGLVMLISASETGFAVLTAALLMLWLITTVHHVLLARNTSTAASTSPAPQHRPHPVGSR